jgi:hypothetical protein
MGTPFVAPDTNSAWAQYTLRVKNRDALKSDLAAVGMLPYAEVSETDYIVNAVVSSLTGQ